MAVMYRPIKEKHKDKYSIIDYEPNEDMQELMKFAPLDAAISASVFFWNLGSELLSSLTSYLQREMKKMKDSASIPKGHNLADAGDGIIQSMRFLKETLLSLTQLPNYDLLNVSLISPSRSKKRKSKTGNLNDK